MQPVRPAKPGGRRGAGGARHAVQWFVGTIVNKLDAKGRVSVPAGFRDCLRGQGNDGFFCVKAISGLRALTSFGNEEFKRQSEALKPHNPLLDKAHAPRAHSIFGQARHMAFDETGRCVLPADLVAFLGLTDQVCFVGLGDVFEIWNPADVPEIADQRMETTRGEYDGSGA